MRGLAKIAQDLGDGDIRLTVWQNLLISGVADDKVALAVAAIEALGLATQGQRVPRRACRLHRHDRLPLRRRPTPSEDAEDIAQWCEARVALDGPVNIHLTGCHHSCAQHYIGDIGLLACKVDVGEDADPVEGYHVWSAAASGRMPRLARDIYRDVKAEDVPRTVERMLKGYLAQPRRRRRDLPGLLAPP